jgi:hypothetical protein
MISPIGKRIQGFILVFVSVGFILGVGCMDPNEYEPEGPPEKTDPPEGPSVLQPDQDTLFRCEYYYVVTLDWTRVNGAQGYEFQIDRDSTFATSYPYQHQYPPTLFSAYCFLPATTYYFRVRAYSDAWTWYTNWSDTRRFHLMPVQDDTIFR